MMLAVLFLASCLSLTFAQEVPSNEIRVSMLPFGGTIGYARRLTSDKGASLWLSYDAGAWLLAGEGEWILLTVRSKRNKGWIGEVGLGWARWQEEVSWRTEKYHGLGWGMGVVYHFSKNFHLGLRLWGKFSGGLDPDILGLSFGVNF